MKALLFLLVAMVAIAGTLAAEGCSTYGTFPEYTQIFHSACVSHDRCYDRCPGKDNCDRVFLRDMQAICRGRPSDKKCMGRADIFYTGVRSFLGGNAYERSCGRRSR